jgi:hypothetical protein
MVYSSLNFWEGILVFNHSLVVLETDIYLNFGIQDPKFWTRRPLSDLMVRAAADDVRFLPYIFHKMMERLNERSLWQLAVRGALYCRCFCITDNEYADWPSIPTIPGLFYLLL